MPDKDDYTGDLAMEILVRDVVFRVNDPHSTVWFCQPGG